MVEKISVQIALDGGAEIEKQLAGIGEAGQKAFADISKSAEQVGFNNIKPEEVTAKLQEMGVTGVDAISKIQKAVASASRLETLVRGISSVETALVAVARAAPLVATAIVAAMTSATKATIAFAESVNKVNDAAIKIGQPIEKVDQFRAALEKAGVSAKSVGEILQSKLASEQGVKGLEAFIRSLEQMPNSAARSAAAIKEFGDAGAELIRILQAGRQLTGFKVEGLISAEDAKRATELGIAINQLETSFGRLNTLGFAPALTTGINVATSAVESLGQRLQLTPWSTFFNAANLGLSPIASLISTINNAITALDPPIQQVGITTQQVSSMFTQWGTVAQQSGQQAANGLTQTGTAAQTAGPQVTGMFTQWGTSADEATAKTNAYSQSIAGIVWDNIKSDGVASWNALTDAIGKAINKLLEWIGLKQGASSGSGSGSGSGATGSFAGGGLLGGRGTGTSDSNLAWVSRGEHIMPASVVRQPGVLSFLEVLRRGGGIPGFAEGGAVHASLTLAALTLDNLSRTTARRAAGGLLGGRGSGTSDSNLAWVSRGEYITPARAVGQPGVLSFLEALRRSGGNLTAVLNGMGRFALGGLVPRMPAFAAGGLAGGSHVTIQFPGLPAIGGLRASSDVVDQLHRAAALAQVRSGGRKPSRYS